MFNDSLHIVCKVQAGLAPVHDGGLGAVALGNYFHRQIPKTGTPRVYCKHTHSYIPCSAIEEPQALKSTRR